MIYQYVVVLKNPQNRYMDLLGIFLSVLSLAFFAREMLVSGAVSLAYPLGIIFIVGVLIWNLYQSYRKGRKVYYSRALLIAALVWMKMPYFQWITFVLIILAFLEYQAKYSVEIGFSEKEIVINTLFRKRYHWKDFTNIMLKDNLLTMDFVNNRLLQKEIEDEEDYEADEDEFNGYCRQMLAKVRAADV